MPLEDHARGLLTVAERLRGPFGNAANTRALLVEPMLSALGWDITDVEQVVREWPLQRGAVSYALMNSGEPVLFTEVRGVGTGIDESGSGLPVIEPGTVPWLALTDGLSYRIFSAPEAEFGEARLICSAELAEVAAGVRTDCDSLVLLSRGSVLDGSLQESADRLFADPRVREALVELTRNPSPAFMTALSDEIGTPVLREAALRAALRRVFASESASQRPEATPSARATPTADAPPTSHVASHDRDADSAPPPPWFRPAEPSAVPPTREGTAGPAGVQAGAEEKAESLRALALAPLESISHEPTAQSHALGDATEQPAVPFGNGQSQYPLVDFLVSKPSAIVELFEQLDAYALSLGSDLTRRVNSDYVEYLRERTSRFTLELYQHRIIMHLWLDPAAIQAWWWAEDATRHMIDVRDRGSGAAEYSVSDVEQLPDAKELIRLAYSGFPERRD